MTNHRVLIVAGSLLTVAVMAAPAAAAQSKCAAAQYKAMGKKYLSKLKCYAKAATNNEPVDATCLQNAENKFAIKWIAALDKGDCYNGVSEAQGEGAVDTCVTAAETLLGTASPGVCAENGSATACNASNAPNACWTCCFNSPGDCVSDCTLAHLVGCGNVGQNTACAQEINAAGCGDECCP